MAQGGSADDRIALRIDTTADLSGIRSVRAETTALGEAARKATEEAERTITITAEQSAEAWKRAGGSVSAYNTEIDKIIAREETLAAKARFAADQMARQTNGVLQGPTAPQLGPALPGTTSALAAAAAADAQRKSLDKIPSSARTAANAVGILSQAAVSGTGSMAGLATAAGSVAFGISALSSSAKVASSAAGIGAIITIAALAAEALLKMNSEAKTSQAFLDHVAALNTRNIAGAEAELALQERRVAELQAKAKAAADRDLIGAASVPGTDAHRAQQELDVALELRNTLAARTRKLDKEVIAEQRDRTLELARLGADAQITAVGRYAAALRAIDTERTVAIATDARNTEAANLRAANQKRALAKEAEDYIDGLGEASAAAIDAMTRTTFQARINAANRLAEKEKAAVQDRALSTEKELAALDLIELKRRGTVALAEREQAVSLATASAHILEGSDDPRTALEGRLALIQIERAADEKLYGDKFIAAQIAQQKIDKLQRDSIHQGLAGYGALSAAVKNHGTVVGAMAKAAADAVRLYEVYEKGKSAAISAQMEWAAAMGAFATGNIGGGALHLAAAGGYAAAAVAAGAEALSGGGSGGGGATGGSSSDTSGTFQPRDNNGGGHVTVILQTPNPTTGEILRETIYQIDRSGTLKQPIRQGSLGAFDPTVRVA